MVCYDGEAAPAYSMGSFTASTVPGCRAPHFWLGEGRSLFDALGPVYTLLCLKTGHENAVMVMQAAARLQRMPLQVLDLSLVPDLPSEYVHPLVIVRADTHTVWRGHTLDATAAQEVVSRLCGRS